MPGRFMAKKKNLKQKPVVFNVEDPYQRKLLDHTEQFTNFSGYIKRLIQRDMEGGSAPAAPSTKEDPGVDFKGFI